MFKRYLSERGNVAVNSKNTIDLSMYLFVIIALLSANRIVYIKNLADMAIFLAASVRLPPRIANGPNAHDCYAPLPDAEAVQDISALRENRVSPGLRISQP